MRPGGASAAQRFSTYDIKVFSQDGEARWVGRGVQLTARAKAEVAACASSVILKL